MADDKGLADRAGANMEQRMDDVEQRAAAVPLGPAIVGSALAIGVMGGGITAFGLVLFVLVQFFS